jgi:hypothetical protein
MNEPAIFTQRRHLSDAMARLSKADSVGAMVSILRETGRAISGADGVTVIRREGDLVAYVAEDAVSPLWTGKRFAIEACISGLAILEGKPIMIPDIYVDPRVPHGAYRPTFVRSMAMYPIGLVEPMMAMGVYWRETGTVDAGVSALLASLARYASVTLSRVGGTQGISAAS